MRIHAEQSPSRLADHDGVIPAPPEWVREMRRITADRGIALVTDGVQTGVGRTGSFSASPGAEIEPDVMVLSEAIGGPLPLPFLVYSGHLDTWQPGARAGTFRGTTLAMAAGAATLRYVRENALDQRAAEAGGRILGELGNLAGQHDCIGDVRGRGLLLGVEVVEPGSAPDAASARPAGPGLALRIRRECLYRGLIVDLGGRHDAVVRLLPPLIITDEEVSTLLERLAEAIAAAQKAVAG